MNSAWQPSSGWFRGVIGLGLAAFATGIILIPLLASPTFDWLLEFVSFGRTYSAELFVIFSLYGVAILTFVTPFFTDVAIVIRFMASIAIAAILCFGIEIGGWLNGDSSGVTDPEIITMFAIAILSAAGMAAAFQFFSGLRLVTQPPCSDSTTEFERVKRHPSIGDLSQWIVVAAVSFAVIRGLGYFNINQLGMGFVLGVTCVVGVGFRLGTLAVNPGLRLRARVIGLLVSWAALTFLFAYHPFYTLGNVFDWLFLVIAALFTTVTYWFISKALLLWLQICDWRLC